MPRMILALPLTISEKIMTKTYEQLTQTLNLTPHDQDGAQLHLLKQWCLEHVSEDAFERTYTDYLDLARCYLDIFLPNIPANLADAIPVFNNMTVLQYAAYRGYDRFIQSSNTSLTDIINSKTQVGMTPLHLAATNGHLHAVDVLLAVGASPRELNNYGEFPIQCSLFTPVWIDADYKNRKTVIFNVLKACAPDTITAMDSQGDTVAHAMAAHGYEALMSDLVREHQPMILSHNNFKKYPIHMAILNDQAGIVKMLLAVDGVISLADAEGRVALHYAAQSELPEIIQDCCQQYTNVDVLDDANKTPLMCAAEVGNLPALITLVEQGADVHLTDCFGLSLLHYAINSESVEMVRWLLEHTSVDINARDLKGETALFCAEQNGTDDITQLLMIWSLDKPHAKPRM